MSFDLYADLAGQSKCPATAELQAGLASGVVDGCTAWSTRDGGAKNEARTCYMKRAGVKDLLSQEIKDFLDPAPPDLQPGWLAIEVSFTLETPWYSKDNRPFHVLDNPVRKDRVFGVPFMSAASWKGLLRWSCRMQAGLREHLDKTGGSLDGWKDSDWILHLFRNEKGEGESFQREKGEGENCQRGALAFYPTWFSRVGFEVINPHSRKTRAGTQPIYYEVVPPGTRGTLRLLYAPLPGPAARDGVEPKDALRKLTEAIEKLLTVYGFSAKRTAGWGLASVDNWTLRSVTASKEGNSDDVIGALDQLLQSSEVRP